MRNLTAAKLGEMETRLKELPLPRNEMRLLLNLCQAAREGCPIIETMAGDTVTGKLRSKSRRPK